jgi:hypothetical protein
MSGAFPVSNLPVRDPPSFASSSKTQPGSCGLLEIVSLRSVRRLLDFDSFRQTSSLVVFQRTPLHRYQQPASGPGLPPNERLTFGVSLPNVTHLPSLSFLPTSTVYSACCFAGLLHPATSRGVRAVSGPVSLAPHCCDGWSPVPFPHPHLIPSKAFPSSAAVLCHHSRFLPVVANVLCFHQTFTRPQGFSPLLSPLPLPMLPSFGGPMLPWALFPFKVLPSFSNALLKNSGASPPKRFHSGPRPPRWMRPGLAPTEVSAEHDQTRSSQRLYSCCCLPRQDSTPRCQFPPACRPYASLPLSFSSDLSCVFSLDPPTSLKSSISRSYTSEIVPR